MKYQIEYFPNPNSINIHVDQRLIQRSSAKYPEENDVYEKLSEPLRSFCAYIHELDGINEETGIGSVYLHRYEIHLIKASIFDWNDLLPHVLNALKTFIASDGELEEKAPPLNRYASASPSSIEEDDHDLVDLDDIVE